jgi:1-deoxy-D-xylulose-5-phosphate reductoisomerase
LEAGGSAPAVLNAANEIAVATFLEGRIPFPDISRLVEAALQENDSPAPQSIEDVFEIDRKVRREVTAMIEERCA